MRLPSDTPVFGSRPPLALLLLGCGLLVGLLVASAAGAEGDTAVARAFFERFQTLRVAGDPALAELYDDGAVIVNVRKYPTGRERRIELEGARYRAILRKSLGSGDSSQDRRRLGNVRVSAEGERVRITATRFEPDGGESPFALLVGPAEGGWRIFEESSESRP